MKSLGGFGYGAAARAGALGDIQRVGVDEQGDWVFEGTDVHRLKDPKVH